MPFFRLYCLDKARRITQREDFDAPDDAAAIAHVRTHHPDSDCELWELGRLVASIPADGPVRLAEAN